MNDHIRLLILSENYPPVIGGSGMWAAQIARHWPGAVSVLAGMGPSGRTHFRREAGNSIPQRRIWLRMHDWGLDSQRSCLQYLNGCAQLIGETRRTGTRGGLVLCGRGLPEGLIARWVGRMTGWPYLCLAHGEELLACGSSGQLRRMLTWAYRGALGVVCNSRNTARLVGRLGIPEDRALVSHPGVEVRPGDREQPAFDDSPPLRLLTVGRLDKRKNHRAVLLAMHRLLQEGWDLRYTIIGRGPEWAVLQGLVMELGLSGKVEWNTHASDEDVRDAYRQADVFVMPSISTATDIEGFGIVYIEAALAGLPSIGGRCGGVAEAVLDGQTGLLADGTDLDDVVRAIRRLLENPALRQRLGKTGWQRAVQEFDWPLVVGQIADDACSRRAQQMEHAP